MGWDWSKWLTGVSPQRSLASKDYKPVGNPSRTSGRPAEDLVRNTGPAYTQPNNNSAQIIQYAMVQAGLIDCGQVTGVFNNYTRDGNAYLAREAAKAGKNSKDYVAELAGFGVSKCREAASSGRGSGGGGGRGRGGGGGGGGGGGPTTSVSRQIRVTDRETARSYLRTYLKDELGRMPTESEVDVFVGNLNGQERQRPTVTTTTTSVAGNTQTSNSTTVEGVNPSAYAEQYAEKNVSPAERTQYKGSQYYDVLVNMIAGGG